MRKTGFVAVFVVVAVLQVATQSIPFSIVNAAPTGGLQQLDEANEIRIVFSEPMVALGRVPDRPTPPWISITPAIPGAYRWSGTTILIFTPDPARPLPYATRYTVTVNRTAVSASGRQLGAPYSFSFTTPTVRLRSVEWSRRQTRFDTPVSLILDFNQPVRVEDVLAHTTVRNVAHDWTPPAFSARERARLNATDPAGLRQFDAKVAATRQAAASTAAVAVRAATDWDKRRFPEAPNRVVLETVAAPAPETHLRVTVDATMPSPQGPVRSGTAQASLVDPTPAFFVRNVRCTDNCEPSRYNDVRLSRGVAAPKFAAALTVRDVTTPASERAIAPKTPVTAIAANDTSWNYALEDAGFDRQPPMSTWALRLDPSLQAEDGQTLGYPWIGIIENGHDKAFISFGDGHGVWEKSGGGQLPFYARNFRDITQWLAPIVPGELVPRLRVLQKNNFEDKPAGAGTTQRLGGAPDTIQSHGLDMSKVLSPQGTGLLWAALAPGEPIAGALAADQLRRSTIVQVTNLGLTVKDSPSSTLIFVTRLDNGEAVADAKVSLVNLANKTLWRGKTGKDGVAMAPALALRRPGYGDGEYPAQYAKEVDGQLSYVAIAEKDGDIAYVCSDWQEGLDSWEFGLNYDIWQATAILRGSVFTDRGVYKPGEEVHFKAIVRADTPAGMQLLKSGTPLDIRVTDSRDRLVDTRSVKVNKWSGADWAWTVPADGATGNYRVTVWMHGEQQPEGNDTSRRERAEWLKHINGDFLVAAYRRPDFRVETTLTPASPSVAGEPLHGVVDGRYLFGNPMAKRSVRWTLKRSITSGAPAVVSQAEPWKQFRFGYYPSDDVEREARVGGETSTLTADGKLILDLPTATGFDLAHVYTFEGEVEDVSRQRIANRSSVVVYPASVFVGLRMTDFFTETTKGADVDVAAVDHSARAVAGVKVTLSLTRVNWNSVRRAEGAGFYTWETEKVLTPAGEWTVTTAATPTKLHIPVPEGGYYELKAVAQDTGGRSTRTDVSFYGVGKGYTAWERYDHNRITLKSEREIWKPGETARVMIQSPWETATALLTVEREGVRRYERFTLTSTQQTVEVPITEGEIPNVFVSVLLVRGRTTNDVGTDGNDPGKPAFRLGYVELRIEDASKQLAVQVSADRAEYRPANMAKVSVAVTDAAKLPARSEVTLWAVDYGVLSLTGYDLPDIVQAVYESKALQVATVDSRQRIISRRVLTPKGDSEGGGGGADAGMNAMRKDFRPLAFWLGSIETDKNGRATAEFKLPDSLTTYRILAVAGDTQSRFGSAKPVEIIVNKPLTLLPAFPRFLALGDRATFGGAITNTLRESGQATVTIKSLDPDVLQFEGGSQTLTLGGGMTEAVRFAAAARAVGTARIQMTAQLGANSDAFESVIPVTITTPIQTQAAFGQTDGRSVEKIMAPANALPQVGGLQIDLASTALVGLGEGVRYLADYYYGCAEQKASKAMVLLLAADLGHAFGMNNISAGDYRKQATTLLKDLRSYQCEDGGFTLWPGQCQYTNAYLTAYVLHVMKVTSAIGATSDPDLVARALGFLDDAFKTTPPQQIQMIPYWASVQAFGIKVKAEYGRNVDADITRLAAFVDRTPVFGLSYLADAMAASNERGARYQDVVRRITNAMRIEGDQAHVEDNDPILGWLWVSNVTSTSVVLDGFVRRGDDPVFVQRMVRWLLAARKNGRWSNTHENAWALKSLVAYYRKFEAEPPNMTASVALGSKTLGSANFRGRTTVAQTMQLPMRELIASAVSETDLAISRTGSGNLFYTTRLRFATSTPPPVSDAGIRVERTYEQFVEGGSGPAGTTFNAGDLVRVTLTITLPKERRFVAVTDPLPAGLEAVDGWFRTTAADLAAESDRQNDAGTWLDWWRRGGFDRTEKYDDRVQLFATRLSEGRHEFSYLARATTSGTFVAPGTSAEEMYAPEVSGRAAPATVIIR